MNSSAQNVVGLGKVKKIHLSNTTVIAKTFLGCWLMWVYSPMCLCWNVNTEICSLLPLTKLMQWKLLSSCWFQITALQNHYLLCLLFILNLVLAQVGLGKILQSPKSLWTSYKQNKMKSSKGLAWISGLSFEDWFHQLLFLIFMTLSIFCPLKWQI